MTLKIDFDSLIIKMRWFLTQPTQVTASSIEKVYYWWFHVLGKLAMCSKSEVMLKDSTTLSVNVPWVLLTPFLRIGARHRAFFSSLDLWRLVQETILYFTVFYCAVLSTCNELYLSDFRLQNQWTLNFVTIATLGYRHKRIE